MSFDDDPTKETIFYGKSTIVSKPLRLREQKLLAGFKLQVLEDKLKNSCDFYDPGFSDLIKAKSSSIQKRYRFLVLKLGTIVVKMNELDEYITCMVAIILDTINGFF